MGARYAGAAIGADTYLPNMATEEFLPALSRAALEQCAEASDVAKQVRVKDTRAAMVARFSEGTFVYPAARFAPTEAELEARRNPASMFGGSSVDDEPEADDGEAMLDGSDDAAMDDDDDAASDEMMAEDEPAASLGSIVTTSTPEIQIAA